MRTTVYVDGYNLYYGCLQGTPWKWLNVHALIQGILQTESPSSRIVTLRYFTSPVIARLARRGQTSVEAQNAYLKALRTTDTDIVFGRHQLEAGMAPRRIAGRPPSRDESVEVWHLTEKETDVRLALTLYRDAERLRAEQIVLVSGDSDMIPALQAVREDFNLTIGLILPRRARSRRATPALLPDLADWTRSHIEDAELAASQFPAKVPTLRTPAIRPDYW